MSSVNTETGEIVGTELAPIDRTAVSVVTTLENAKRWLSTAVEMTGPEEIAAAKAHIRTAETYARELDLSKDIQLDAAEMVRRAEYALGKAIRKGQAEGTIARVGTNSGPRGDYQRGGQTVRVDRDADNSAISPKRFLPHGHDANQVYAMTDGVTEEEFDAALEEAKSEKNLSRANVVRKVRAKSQTRDDRADLIEKLAAEGYSSRQMPPKVGVSEETVRQIARDFGIEIPADKIVGRTRRLDHTQIVNSTVTDLENTAEFIQSHIDLAQVDFAEADEWLSSLTNSIRVLNRFVKQIKENSHV